MADTDLGVNANLSNDIPEHCVAIAMNNLCMWEISSLSLALR